MIAVRVQIQRVGPIQSILINPVDHLFDVGAGNLPFKRIARLDLGSVWLPVAKVDSVYALVFYVGNISWVDFSNIHSHIVSHVCPPLQAVSVLSGELPRR